MSLQKSKISPKHVITPLSSQIKMGAEPSDSDSDPEETLDLFAEPADYYPPPPQPTIATHTLLSGQVLNLHLVGHNPLWGHHLWNAGRVIATYLEKNPSLVTNKTVLELGAGAGLPSLVCAVLGARKVVVSDYPDAELVQNLKRNILASGVSGVGDEECRDGEEGNRRVVAEGVLLGC